MAKGETMVELDFFRLEKEKVAGSTRAMDGRNSSARAFEERDRPKSRRMACGGGGLIGLPLSASVSDADPESLVQISSATAPLTIFYNGTVAVFDLPQDKAEVILKLAEEVNDVKGSGGGGRREESLLDELNGDLLPLARRKSLQRFLSKRKERLTVAWPYVKGMEEMERVGLVKEETSDPMSPSSIKAFDSIIR